MRGLKEAKTGVVRITTPRRSRRSECSKQLICQGHTLLILCRKLFVAGLGSHFSCFHIHQLINYVDLHLYVLIFVIRFCGLLLLLILLKLINSTCFICMAFFGCC